jgi:predicted secreted Zn-dependent protease
MRFKPWLRRDRWLLAVLLSVTLLAAEAQMAAAFADPIVTETFDYYDVDGATAQEIRTDLNQRGPIDGHEHRHFDAVTHWYVRWRFTYGDGANNCEIASVSTNVDVTYAFPRLRSESAAPAELRQAFSGYLEKLLTHEKGHAEIAIDIAAQIEKDIRSLPPAPTCASLGEIANNLGRFLMKKANLLEIDYDARTVHGKTQGARFP